MFALASRFPHSLARSLPRLLTCASCLLLLLPPFSLSFHTRTLVTRHSASDSIAERNCLPNSSLIASLTSKTSHTVPPLSLPPFTPVSRSHCLSLTRRVAAAKARDKMNVIQ